MAQAELIDANIIFLIKNTICDRNLLTYLQEVNILEGEKVAELLSTDVSPLEKSKRLYKILVTRPGFFPHFIKALEKTHQHKIIEILQKQDSKLCHYGLISVGKHQLIGKGKSGSKVYKGKFGDKKVAVKICKENLERSLREVETLKELGSHKNIVEFFATEKSNKGHLCIATELCYINLYNEVKLAILNLDSCIVLRECTEGLAYIHSKNLIHGNLNTENILISRSGVVKISDFSFSMRPGTKLPTTKICEIVGTADWTAPEVLSLAYKMDAGKPESKITQKADIFSLGCIFYFVLTKGMHAFGLIFERAYNIINNVPQFTAATLENDMWRTLISQMLSNRPTQRPSATDILQSDSFCVDDDATKSEPIWV